MEQTPAQMVVNTIIDDEHDGVIASMCKRTGLTRSTIDNLRFGKTRELSSNIVNVLHRTYPKYALQWLFTGEGDKLSGPETEVSRMTGKKPSASDSENNVYNQIISNYESRIKCLEDENTFLRQQLAKALATILNLSGQSTGVE